VADAPVAGAKSLPPQIRLDEGDVLEAMEVVPAGGSGPGEDEVLAEVDADEAGATQPLAESGEPEPSAPERRVSGFDGVGTRRESRERALALLYEAEQKDLARFADLLDTLPVAPEPFAAVLVIGVSDHMTEIDDLIGRYSVGWTVVRMPAIDRNLLRMATFELGWTDVPVGACISEAVELAKRYSTDDSHTFVNGLLSRLANELREA